MNYFQIGVAVGEIGDQRKVASSLVIKYKVCTTYYTHTHAYLLLFFRSAQYLKLKELFQIYDFSVWSKMIMEKKQVIKERIN